MNVRITTIAMFGMLAFCGVTRGQDAVSYQVPAEELVEIVDAKPTPSVNISPDGNWMLIMERPSLPSIEEVSQPELRLAGLRINPVTNGPSRESFITGLQLLSIPEGRTYEINGLPVSPRISAVNWSPDSREAAFVLTCDEGIELWLLDIQARLARALTGSEVNNAVSGFPYLWSPDSKSLIFKSTDKQRVAPPEISPVPQGPVIQENTGRRSPVRTYQDMLKNPHDESVFEYYTTSQLVQVMLDGKRRELGRKDIIIDFSMSPDGKYLLVETIRKPFSYLVPFQLYPLNIEVWDLGGNHVHTIANLPLADNIPTGFGSVRKGPRSVRWRPDVPAQLFWVEALDDGDGSREVEFRDQVFSLKAPFGVEAEKGPKCGLRYGGIAWGDGSTAVLFEYWWRTRKEVVSIFEPDNLQEPLRTVFELNMEDRYADPGSFIATSNAAGHRVLLTGNRGRNLYLRGNGASPRGYEPFIDSYDLRTGETKRLWQSGPPYFEYPVRVVDIEKGEIIISRESVTDQTNYYLLRQGNGELRQLTFFPHPHPELSELGKKLLTYRREDGVQLSGTLYLPYRDDSMNRGLPLLIWAYPREFKDAASAGQVGDSPFSFDRITYSSPLIWLTRGYAVLNDATMPIIGEGEEEPNDRFREQLVSSAEAAVDTVVAMGVADPGKIVIGGHSYGAFMTANLLAHSDLFAAGIARSGAYNRTLTPFGFQAEERTYWEAPEVYHNMSPFMHADKINEPILLIHGQADNNSGTFPLQSERFYHALKGHGATARLVLLPHESHSYKARESILHMLWEMDRWIRKYAAGE